ncbi:MAG: rhomboid family intramembrane serine protease [Planctomycetes bacterium]|nr:rhomboid family intramembrane serine protease [Planctomycetota bacterium]
MRQIGTLVDERQAMKLTAYLFTLGIRSQLEEENGEFLIWAHDEDRISQAREEFQQFVQDPGAARYQQAEEQAGRLQATLVQQEMERRKSAPIIRPRPLAPSSRGLTFVLIVICVAIGFATNFGEDREDSTLWRNLLIDGPVLIGGHFYPRPKFSADWDVLHGQFWRLITPILLHAGPMHLLFNMMGLHNLGKLIEARFGSRTLLGLVLVIALVSNLVQYAWGGPYFVGISGVVLGLFGYLWMKSVFDPTAGFRIASSSIVWMLIFVGACFTGAFGPIANGSHLGGLLTGMALGYAPVLFSRFFGR